MRFTISATQQLSSAAIQEGNYTTLVIFAAVGYDYILTFSDEIEYIWSMPWTRFSTLYLLARYFGLCFVTGMFLSTSFRRGDILYTLGIWSALTFVGAADFVMISRVWAIYGRSKFILGMLLTFYSVEIIAGLIACVILSVRGTQLVGDPTLLLGYSLCAMDLSTVWTEVMDVTQLALAVLMCFLVILSFVKQSLLMYRATKQFHLNRYMNLLTREGMIYFLAMLAYALINIMYHIEHVPTHGWWMVLTVFPQCVPATTLVPRLILSVRKLHARNLRRYGGDVDMAFGSVTSSSVPGAALSAIRFADVERYDSEGKVGERVSMEEEKLGSADKEASV